MTTNEDKAAIADNEKRLAVHEAVCAERYEGIQNRLERGDKRMQRIEAILYFVVLVVIGGKDAALRLIEMVAK